MDLKIEDSTIHSFPHGFVTKKGDPILITTLDEKRCERLTEMYLAFEPRDSFQDLPPVGDDACVKWVQHMIQTGINLVAMSFEEGIVGHVALFPIDQRKCELLMVVSPSSQNVGIGTELARCAIQLSQEIGFEEIDLSVEAKNARARHVYKKCGFEYLTYDSQGEVDMAIDLTRYHEAVSAAVDRIMNTNPVTIRDDQSCREALDVFLRERIGSLPVIGEGEKLVGIISTIDLIVPSQIDKRVIDVLTREVVTVPTGCKIEKLVRLFQSAKIRCIPVVDSEKRLAGVVSRQDVLGYYAEQCRLDGPQSEEGET